MRAKDEFQEFEKKVRQVADRLKAAQEKQAEQRDEIEKLRADLRERIAAARIMEEEIKNLKKERELIKNKVERMISAIDLAGGE